MDTPPIRSRGTDRPPGHATGPARRTRARVVLATALVPALAALASCTQDVDRYPGLPTGVGEVAVGLVAAPDCDQLVQTTRDGLLATVDQLEAQRDAMGATEDLAGSDGAVDRVRRGRPHHGRGLIVRSALVRDGGVRRHGSDAAGSGTVVAGTNNQEAGVDEADLAKTDGRRLVTVVDGVLRVTVLDDAPGVDGTLDLPGGAAGTLFLRGDEAFVIGDGWSGTVGPLEDGTTGTTVLEGDTIHGRGTMPIGGTSLTRVDLSDPAAPEVVESARVEGDVVASRMIDGTVRVVVRSTPVATEQLWWTEPSAARSSVAALDAEDLLPRWSVDDGDAGPLGGCEDVLTVPAPSDGGGGTDTTLAGGCRHLRGSPARRLRAGHGADRRRHAGRHAARHRGGWGRDRLRLHGTAVRHHHGLDRGGSRHRRAPLRPGRDRPRHLHRERRGAGGPAGPVLAVRAGRRPPAGHHHRDRRPARPTSRPAARPAPTSGRRRSGPCPPARAASPSSARPGTARWPRWDTWRTWVWASGCSRSASWTTWPTWSPSARPTRCTPSTCPTPPPRRCWASSRSPASPSTSTRWATAGCWGWAATRILPRAWTAGSRCRCST